MPVVAASARSRRRVRFPTYHRQPDSLPGQRPDQSTTATRGSDIMAAASGHDFEPRVPSVFCEQRAIRDQLDTETRRLQDETVLSCLPYLRGTDKTVRDCLNAHGVAWLQRDHHIEYLYDSLEDYPGSFVSFDSSRPWLSYWGLAGLALLGEDVTKYRHR